jgi:hypothetical protein
MAIDVSALVERNASNAPALPAEIASLHEHLRRIHERRRIGAHR